MLLKKPLTPMPHVLFGFEVLVHGPRMRHETHTLASGRQRAERRTIRAEESLQASLRGVCCDRQSTRHVVVATRRLRFVRQWRPTALLLITDSVLAITTYSYITTTFS